jgi:hypothetical protein
MVDPKVHQKVDIHGTVGWPEKKNGQIHFHTDEAHMKEWPNLVRYTANETKLRDPLEFALSSTAPDAGIHNFASGHKENPGPGLRTFYFDDKLQEWFDFVANQAREQ